MDIKNQLPIILALVQEFCKPENLDLFLAITNVTEGSLAQSFLFGFTHRKIQTVEEYQAGILVMDSVLLLLGAEADTRTLDERYADYIDYMQKLNQQVALTQAQTDRFQAILNAVAADNMDWSGGYYSVVMRRVQDVLICISTGEIDNAM